MYWYEYFDQWKQNQIKKTPLKFDNNAEFVIDFDFVDEQIQCVKKAKVNKLCVLLYFFEIKIVILQFFSQTTA